MDEHWQELLHADRQMKGVVDMIKKRKKEGLLSGMKGVGGWKKDGIKDEQSVGCKEEE